MGEGRRLCALLALFLVAGPTWAADRIEIVERHELDMGMIILERAGEKTVDAEGKSYSINLPMVHGSASPAQFDILYIRDPANPAISANRVVELMFFGTNPVGMSPHAARITRFYTNLPDHPLLMPGEAVQIAMTECSGERCVFHFRLGATVAFADTRAMGNMAFPIAVQARIVSVH